MTEPPPGSGPVDLLRPGFLLREWRIGSFLARGAFGQVFQASRASWNADEPPRALKVFDPILSSAARAALVSEFDTLRRMRHRHLLRGEDAFDVVDGPLAGCVVFVLELADTDLSSEIGRRGRLPPAEVASIGAQVAQGLAALHGAGKLHGDVKPANLLRVGPDWKLGDFGVSVAVQGSYAVAPGATLDYTPPELSTESDGFRVHRSSDVWALGVTLWMAATGRHPFVGAAPYTRLAAAMRGDRAPAEIEPRLAELIDRCCLVHDPRSRADAAEVAERLARLAGEIARPAGRLASAPSPPGSIPYAAGPVAAGPVAAGPVAAGPVAAGPVAAGPIAAGPIAAGPFAPSPSAPGPSAVGRWAEGPPAEGLSAPGPSAPGPPASIRQPPASGAGPGPNRPGTGAPGPVRLLTAGLAAVAVTVAVVILTSLAAAAVPAGLGVRRAVYLVLTLLVLAALGWPLRRRGAPGQRALAVAGAAGTVLAATGYLFWGS